MAGGNLFVDAFFVETVLEECAVPRELELVTNVSVLELKAVNLGLISSSSLLFDKALCFLE